MTARAEAPSAAQSTDVVPESPSRAEPSGVAESASSGGDPAAGGRISGTGTGTGTGTGAKTGHHHPAAHVDPDARREAFREETVRAIPAGYSPVIHLVAPAIFCAIVFVACLSLVRDLRAVELWTVPLTLFSGFAFEWRVHKSILHRRIPGLAVLYVRHELHHHVIYTYDDMTMRARREWRLVLMPAYAIVLVFAMLIPLGVGLWKLVGANVALLHVATSMVFFLTYEWMHLAYHLPKEHPVSRIGLIQRLRELHRRHHEPRLMKRWNFNVTFPIFDWLHGTAWSTERERDRDRKRKRHATI